MKKLYPLVLFLFFFNFYTKAQYVDIHSTALSGFDEFRDFLVAKYPNCFNAAGLLDTTCTEITTEDSLTYTGPGQALDLTAIQYFDGLQYFRLSNVKVYVPPTRLPSTLLTLYLTGITYWFYGSSYLAISPSLFPAGLQSLTYTDTYYNFSNTTWPAGLKYLNIDRAGCTNGVGNPPSTLETLICSNQFIDPGNWTNNGDYFNAWTTLTTLPSLPSSLVHLDCNHCNLTTLPALPATLTWLDCSMNYSRSIIGSSDEPIPTLTDLPALPAGLIYLKCASNRLTSLPALPASLVYLNCRSNKFYLHLTQTMTTYFEWDYPGISNLPALPATLQYLNCAGNSLSSLPALPPVLSDLNLDARDYVDWGGGNGSIYQNNHMTTLPPLPQTLTYLNCKWMYSLACIPHLPASMGVQSAFNSEPYNLILDYTAVNCIPNSVPGMRFAGTLPLCNMANNTNTCEINPIIEGTVFYDNNSNGVQDAGEMPRANVRVNYSTGLQTFTDLNGHYEGTANIGSNTVTVVPPVYYDAVPATVTHTVSAPNTVVTDLIALQPNTMVDSLKITITGQGTMRPGDGVVYYIKYENVGTTILNPNIVINYFMSSGIHYTGCTNSSVIDNGSSLTLNLNNFQPGQHGGFNIGFMADFNINTGGLGAIATITGGTSTCSDGAGTVIVASYDPNEKQATTTLTTQQVSGGNYINYAILFQNTGTASALHVFLTDTLNALLQANTLEMIESSHACRVTQSGNKLLFEFVNIHLPDSNHNEPQSHGYVRFRVKPVSTLHAGDIVPNQASIYFDFNEPVQTNIATTTIIGPLINVDQDINGLTTMQGTASASGTYNLSASNLVSATGNITITPGSFLEVSTDNNNFSSSPINIAYTASGLASTPVYVRISSNAVAGPFSGTIINAGGGANNAIVHITGNVTAAPVAVIIAGPEISGLSTIAGTASSPGAYNLSAHDLSTATGSVTITPSALLEVSTDNINFSASPISIGYASGLLASTTIFTRISAGAPAGAFSGTVTNSGGGAANAVVPVSGTVEELLQTSIALFPNPASTKLTLGLPGNTATVSISIYNMKGQLVKKLTSDKEITPINVSDLSRGVYVVKIKGENINIVRKLVVN